MSNPPPGDLLTQGSNPHHIYYLTNYSIQIKDDDKSCYSTPTKTLMPRPLSIQQHERKKKTFKGNTVKEQNRLVARAVVLPELKELEWGGQVTSASHPRRVEPLPVFQGQASCLKGGQASRRASCRPIFLEQIGEESFLSAPHLSCSGNTAKVILMSH